VGDVIEPTGEAALAEAVRDSAGRLIVRGGGTRSAPAEGAVLSVAALSGIALYEPGALTLVAAAGTPMVEIEAALAEHGQALAFEPMDHRALLGTTGEPTIGGAAATAASGPRRVRAGGLRDSLIGVRFVDGSGRVLRSGGRVMKNVTGYDLARLQAGAHGTLGVLTEVAFKLLPTPSGAATLTLAGLDVARSVQAMTAALGSPFEVSGAARLPDGATHLRIEGLPDSVAYRAERLTDLLAPFGEVRTERDPEAVAALWRGVRDVEPLADAPGGVWRVASRPTEAAAAVQALGAERAMLDAGGATIWAALPEGVDARARVPGPATLVRGGGFPRAHPEPPGVAALSEGLRARFDPRGVFARAA
jgi:glycolate oxidase FAD binding subunit